MFGRGQRDELDDDEAEKLVRELRANLWKEVVRMKEEENIDVDVDGLTEKQEVKRWERL